MLKLVLLYIVFLKVTETIDDFKGGLTVYLTSLVNQSQILISLRVCYAIIYPNTNSFRTEPTLANLSENGFVETIRQLTETPGRLKIPPETVTQTGQCSCDDTVRSAAAAYGSPHSL